MFSLDEDEEIGCLVDWEGEWWLMGPCKLTFCLLSDEEDEDDDEEDEEEDEELEDENEPTTGNGFMLW